jgi:hypothetical protein
LFKESRWVGFARNNQEKCGWHIFCMVGCLSEHSQFSSVHYTFSSCWSLLFWEQETGVLGCQSLISRPWGSRDFETKL